jgi:hypothetical protein
MQIMIGADELILWLRKNKKAVDEENMALGLKIVKLIEKLGGQPKIENHPSLWANDLSDAAIAALRLPKTSEQYIIDVDILPSVYKELNTW